MVDSENLPTISSSRVSLRELRDGDVCAFFAIFSDPEVMRYWSRLPVADLEEARRMLTDIQDRVQQRSFFKWGITRNTDERLIGTCTLFHVEIDHRRAEVGYALGREYWGKGYMQEALNALINFSFNELNMHRIEADVDPRNAASIKTLERLGFQREGYLRERWQVGGEIQDALFFGLLRREWKGASSLVNK